MLTRPYTLECTHIALVSDQFCSGHTAFKYDLRVRIFCKVNIVGGGECEQAVEETSKQTAKSFRDLQSTCLSSPQLALSLAWQFDSDENALISVVALLLSFHC